jgi:hypothetical protein
MISQWIGLREKLKTGIPFFCDGKKLWFPVSMFPSTNPMNIMVIWAMAMTS